MFPLSIEDPIQGTGELAFYKLVSRQEVTNKGGFMCVRTFESLSPCYKNKTFRVFFMNTSIIGVLSSINNQL